MAERKWINWFITDELSKHYFDYNLSGAKPDDPGWHQCTCGLWEGYWVDYDPHVAAAVVEVLEEKDYLK